MNDKEILAALNGLIEGMARTFARETPDESFTGTEVAEILRMAGKNLPAELKRKGLIA